MFHYSSSTTHGYVGTNGKKVKTTNVDVANGKGVIQVMVEDDKGIHSDKRKLNSEEIKNIQTHKFMPNLFKNVLNNVRLKKTKTRRSNKKGTRKTKK